MWPLLTVGAIGPAVALFMVAFAAWWWFQQSLEQSRRALTERALESLKYASRNVAAVAEHELERRFLCVEQIAADGELCAALAEYQSNEEVMNLGSKLSDPVPPEMQLQPYREKFKRLPQLEKVAQRLRALIADHNRFEYASWFLTDARGLQIARLPESVTIGQNYAWRTYFHGGPRDEPLDWRPTTSGHIRHTHLSALYRSQSTRRWSVAISTPIFKRDGSQEFLGTVAMTFEIGRQLIPLAETARQFPVLVDMRAGERPGLIVQHPQLDSSAVPDEETAGALAEFRLTAEMLPEAMRGTDHYLDPLSAKMSAEVQQARWLAWRQDVQIRGKETGWVVIVQEAYEQALGDTLNGLRVGFLRSGWLALAAVSVVIGGLWIYCLRRLGPAKDHSFAFRTLS
jgi:hypothetical protein